MENVKFNEEEFVSLLEKVIGEAKFVQNNAPENIPEEDRVAQHVLEYLKPVSTENGGPLKIEHIHYVEKRGNLILTLPGETDETISFVGAHMDVVTANPEDWSFDPFKLTRDGDKLRGRGTTDCLGHVVLVTCVMKALAAANVKLRRTIVAVLIANEENSSLPGIGVDKLVDEGKLEFIKKGPVYVAYTAFMFWTDVADQQPCNGTGGMASWKLKATGKLFHSGIPQNAINPIELCSEALSEIQRRFYADFPAHPKEAEYKFKSPSTMKPTQWGYPGGSVNQIPREAWVCGDLRITPFHDVKKVAAAIDGYVADINANIGSLATRGPMSKYELPEEGLRGKIEFIWDGAPMAGIAVDMTSPGYAALCKATEDIFGSVNSYAITGSLPCVRELQEAGFDIQMIGFGFMKTYHAVDEYASLEMMGKGFHVLLKVIENTP